MLALQKALNKETHYSSASEKEIFDKFEELFEKGDGREMGTLRLCGHNKPEDDYLKAILVDCLMYEDDALFAKALAALDREYGQVSSKERSGPNFDSKKR